MTDLDSHDKIIYPNLTYHKNYTLFYIFVKREQ